MVNVVVNFPLPEGTSLDDFKGAAGPMIPRYQGVPGLLRKNFLYDGQGSVGGGNRRLGSLC